MNPLEKLKDGLLSSAKEQCKSISNQALIPPDLYIYYALHEQEQVLKKLHKLIDGRLEQGVSWDQISALHTRVTGAQGRYDRAKKKAAKLKEAHQEAPDEKGLKDKLKAAEEKAAAAAEELKQMNSLSAKVAAYKQSQEGRKS